MIGADAAGGYLTYDLSYQGSPHVRAWLRNPDLFGRRDPADVIENDQRRRNTTGTRRQSCDQDATGSAPRCWA